MCAIKLAGRVDTPAKAELYEQMGAVGGRDGVGEAVTGKEDGSR
jgi:hypothetical protein